MARRQDGKAARRRDSQIRGPRSTLSCTGGQATRATLMLHSGCWARYAAALLVALGTRHSALSTVPQPPAVPVEVAEVIERQVAAGQTLVGTVVPLRVSTVGSAVDGRVIEFPVNEGDRVRKGQPLAQLLTQTLEIELAAAKAELEARQQELAELENGSRPEEIEQAKARMLAAKAAIDFWGAKRRRQDELFQKSRSVSEEELEQTLSSWQQAEQAHLEAKAAWELAVKGPRPEKIAQARARAAAQQELVHRIEDQIEKHTIVAPFDGYVVAEHTEVGQWVARGDPVAQVAELDTVDVSVPVLEDHVRHLEIGTEARVEVGALPDEAFAGRVAIIVPQADVRSRTFPVKVRLKNRSGSADAASSREIAEEGNAGEPLLKAGMFARVTLPVGKPEQALLVSKDALVLGGPAPLVYVVDAQPSPAPRAKNGQTQELRGKVRAVAVELGVADGGLIQVRGPLQVRQYVVIHGNERLRPGQDVIAATAPGAPPAAAGGN